MVSTFFATRGNVNFAVGFFLAVAFSLFYGRWVAPSAPNCPPIAPAVPPPNCARLNNPLRESRSPFVLNNGAGFKFLDNTSITSVMIEIGLHNEFTAPLKNMRNIAVEASLRSVRTQPMLSEAEATKAGTTILLAALSDHDGFTDWFERSGWPAANSLGAQEKYVEYRKTLGGPDFTPDAVTIAPMLRLDSILANIPPQKPLIALKVDAQGHNINILRGGGQLLFEKTLFIYTECTMETTLNGKLKGAEIWGNDDDTCPKIKAYLEGLGFTHLITHCGAGDYTVGDAAFVQSKFVDVAKPCLDATFGPGRVIGSLIEHGASPTMCIMKTLHNHLNLG